MYGEGYIRRRAYRENTAKEEGDFRRRRIIMEATTYQKE